MERSGAERAWLEVDLEAIRRNVRTIREVVGARVEVTAVVKANAYGHGAVPVARTALAAGANRLAVATPEEARELRAAGLDGPLCVLGALAGDEMRATFELRATPMLHSLEDLRLAGRTAERLCRVVSVHVKVDTGMSRFGVAPEDAPRLLAEAERSPRVRVEGLATHFANAAEPDAVGRQKVCFDRVIESSRAAGRRPPVLHAANSQALFLHPETHYDLVRPGIALYGIDPGGFFRRAGVRLAPALSLHARIAAVKRARKGQRVGYGGTWTATRDTTIGIIAMGYADGLPCALGNGGEVVIAGHRRPLVGTVMMDYVAVDLGPVPCAAPGDTATFVGGPGPARIGIEEVAARAGVIPYVVPCLFGRRVRRIYRHPPRQEPRSRDRESARPRRRSLSASRRRLRRRPLDATRAFHRSRP